MLNVVYSSHKRRNPNDLMSFILDTFHHELNESKNNYYQPKIPNEYDRNDVVKCGIYNFLQFNSSIISNNFNWFRIEQTKCPNCLSLIYNFDTYNTFELDILGAYKNKSFNSIKLIECTKYTNSNAKIKNKFCQKCGDNTQMSSNSGIFSLSNMIIFSLSRGDLEDNLMNIPFTLQDKIDLTSLVEKGPMNYELTGVVSITKENNNFIFVSFCKSPIDGQWYLYKDSQVQQTDLSCVISLNNNKNYTPCILGYKVKI